MPIGVTNEHYERLKQRLANPYSSVSAGSQNKNSPSLNNSSGGLYYASAPRSCGNSSSISIGISTANFWNGIGSNSGTPKS